MRIKIILLAVITALCLSPSLNAQRLMDQKTTFKYNSPNWIKTGGPGGGIINDVAIDPLNPSILYATGSTDGIYKTSDGGDKWILMKFNQPANEKIRSIIIDKNNPTTLYCYSNGDLLKSVDEGINWSKIGNGFDNCTRYISKMVIDPLNSDVLYIGSGSHCQDHSGTVYMSEDGGLNWKDIGNNLNLPLRAFIDCFGVFGNGKIFIGVNDYDMNEWNKGKVFYSENNGQTWNELNFGQYEDRFIRSILVNPFKNNEIWIGEQSLYGSSIDNPYLYKSTDGGNTWTPIYLNQTYGWAYLIGASADGKIFLGGPLCYTSDGGKTFTNITLPTNEFTASDIKNIAIHPANSNIFYLPLNASGIAYTEDAGKNWVLKNDGVANTDIILLAADIQNPAIIYAVSAYHGVFRSDDYGENWEFLNKNGIAHFCGDELTVDPTDPNTIWYVAHVPYLHKSIDKGNSWKVLNNPYLGGSFSLNSVYVIKQSNDKNVIYLTENGRGIMKGTRYNSSDNWGWTFCSLSDIDYTYSIAVEPENSNIIYSGYSCKPYETKTKIRVSYDGGINWFTSLEVDSASAITSVVIDPLTVNNIYAASIGQKGAQLWKSNDKGQRWNKLNDYFNFTTIHSFATASSGSPIAFAGVWGGNLFKTTNFGTSWKKLNSEETFSTAAIKVDPNDSEIIYIADRTAPIIYKSIDGGENWNTFFNAGAEYRRLMFITIDPTDNQTFYISAMRREGPGKLGGLFKIQNGNVSNISGSLPKVALSLTVDKNNPSILYVVLHESGVYKSIDQGTNWVKLSENQSGLPESGFSNLIIDPNNSNTLYLIGGCDVKFDTFESSGLDPNIVNGVYKSIDGGITWENINRGILGEQSGAIKSLEIYNDDSEMFYLGTESGVYYTTDGGNSWIKSTGLPYTTLGGISISNNIIYAFTNGAGLFRGVINPDYSITWDVNQKIIAEINFAQILKDPQNSSVIYTSGYPGGIFKSTDGGLTWHEKNFGMVSFSVEDPMRQGYYALDINPYNSNILYLGLYGKGVYRSTNGAETWYPINGLNMEMINKKISGIIVDNTNEEKCYVATEEGVFVTENGGVNWSSLNYGLTSFDIKTLFMNHDGELYAGSRGYGFFKLENNTWIPQNAFGQYGTNWDIWDRTYYPYSSILIHPIDNSKMMLGSFPHGIFRSFDGGKNWKESNIGWTNDGVFYLICHPDNPEIVYAGTYNGVNISYDFGTHWQRLDNGWPGEQWVFSIDFDPINHNIMYACSKNGENKGSGKEGFHGTVMKTIDGGSKWFEIVNGLDKNNEFYRILVDHFDNNTLYVVTQNQGVFISTDAGTSWTAWNDGLSELKPGSNGNNVTNPLVISADKSMLYFGSWGSGVFRRMITPILPVNNLYADIKADNIIISWNFDDLNNNFNQYNIYRSDKIFNEIGNMTPYVSIKNVNQKSFSDSNIEIGKQYFYTVTTVDKDNFENKHIYVIGPIEDYGIYFLNSQLEQGEIGKAYSSKIEVQGGVPPYNWSIIEGSLPNGLNLEISSGIISGTPKKSGDFLIKIKVNDSQTPPLENSQQYHLIIVETTNIESIRNIPREYKLYNCYPNPFNPITNIKFDIPKSTYVVIKLYDILGREVQTLVNEFKNAGYYQISLNNVELKSGVYFYRIEADNFVNTKKMIVLK